MRHEFKKLYMLYKVILEVYMFDSGAIVFAILFTVRCM